MISREDYFMGRDKEYAWELTPRIEVAALDTIARVNKLLTVFGDIKRGLTSGWRPAEINAAIPNAAVFSRHMTGQAADIYDPEGDLDEWCLDHREALIACGLWMEHPAATKGWCHLQTVPPKSGNRVFYP